MVFAGGLSAVVLGAVYLADRWEREPVERLQSYYLVGLSVQLIVLLASTAVAGRLVWSGLLGALTVAVAAVVLPFQLVREPELDEAFDGIVYTVAAVTGAVCGIHLNNLPQALAGSPFREALAQGAAPDLRDVLIVASSPGLASELGQAAVMLLAAVIVGAVSGSLLLRGWPPFRAALVAAIAAVAVFAADGAARGGWTVRLLLAAGAVGAAWAAKRRSAFRARPEVPEADVVALCARTVLVILGASLLSLALLRAVAPAPLSHGTVDPVALQPGGEE